jgi:hypothetical protein
MANVICIAGKARAGKDTTANLLKDKLEYMGHRVLILHYADYLKFACKEYFGWNGVKDEAGRTILQAVGTDLARKRFPNIWVAVVDIFMRAFEDSYDYFIVPDCRFPNEIEYLKDKGWNVLRIKVVRLDYDNGLTDEQKSHISETALDNYRFNYVIKAKSGIENVEKEVDLLLETGIYGYFMGY